VKINVRGKIWKQLMVEKTRKAMPKPLLKCAALVEGEAKRSMRAGGRPAKARGPRGGRARGTPSRPGTPPHVQTGNLRASITHALSGPDTAIVGPTREAWYGKVHEFGGRYHPQRPFMRPALRRAVRDFAKQFRRLYYQ